MKTNYILIDFESVHTRSLEQLTQDHFKVLVFIGATQANLPYELAESSQPLGSRVEYIKISGRGPNALDFHIAFYIGRLAAADPSAHFHIISKDTGFDPLIQHLKSKNILAGRVAAVADIPVVKVSNRKLLQERIAVVLTRLRQMKVAKPRTVKTLSSTIALWFQNKLSGEEVSSLVQSLRTRGYLKVDGAKLTYALPNNSPTKPLQRTPG